MSTMKAVRIHRYGGPEVLAFEDAPCPEPAAGEVLVRVRAAAINPVDWKVRDGYLKEHIPYKLPLILGWDVSGVVERVGAGVSGFSAGDEVFSRPDIARDGAYAELIAIKSTEVAKKPRSVDHVHSAAIPLAALTAWQALFEAPAPFASAGLSKSQTVLIHGGAGGVGTFAVQLAKWKGARVIATGLAKNEKFLRDLGADRVIDYQRERFEEVAGGVDAVFDTIGGETQARSWKALRPGGVLVSIVSAPSEDEARAHKARAAYVFVQPNAPQLAALADLVDRKAIRPIVSEVLPLAQARKAHELSQGGHVRGKLVLEIRESRRSESDAVKALALPGASRPAESGARPPPGRASAAEGAPVVRSGVLSSGPSPLAPWLRRCTDWTPGATSMADAAPDSRLSELAIDRSRRKSRRHPARRLAGGLAAAALAALVASALGLRPREIEVTQVRRAAPGESITALTAAGYVVADRRSVIAPKAPGRLEEVEVDEGDRVEEGEVIARLDPLDAEIALRQAEAAVSAARASAAADEAQAVQAERALARAQKLERGGAITREALLDAKAARDAARAQQSAAAARREEAQRALDAARQRLEDTVIRAPFAGTVAKKLAGEGAVLAPAAIIERDVGGIVELVDLGSLYIQAEVSEQQLGWVHVGEPALVFLDAVPGRAFLARTGAVRPVLDRSKGTATVRVELDELSEGPLPDMSARISFLEKEVTEPELAAEPRLRVPASAVVERGGRPVVLVVRGGRVEAAPVQVAGRVGGEAALAQGPEPGTPVVAAPGSRMGPGSRVKVRAKGS